MNKKKYDIISIGSGIVNITLTLSSSLLFIPLIIKNIGLEQFGAWSMISIFTGLSNISNIGLAKAIVYFGSGKKKSDHLKSLNIVYSVAFFLTLVVILIIVIIGTSCIVFKVNFFYSVSSLSQSTQNILFLSGVSIIAINQLTNLYRSILESQKMISFVNIGFGIQSIILYLLIYSLSVFTSRLELFYIATVFVHIILFLYHFIVSKKIIDFKLSPFNKKSIYELLHYASGFLTLTLINSTLLPVNRYLLVTGSGSTTAHAIFDISFKIAQFANNILNVFSLHLYSYFSSCENKDIRYVAKIARQYTIMSFVLYILGCGVFIFIGEELLSIFTGNYSNDFYWTVLILLTTVCVKGVAEPIVRALWGTGNLWVTVRVQLTSPVVYIITLISCYSFSPLQRFSLAYGLPFVITSIMTITIFYVRYYSKMGSGSNL